MTTRNEKDLLSYITDTFIGMPMLNAEVTHDVLEEMARAHAKDNQGLRRVLAGIKEGRIAGNMYSTFDEGTGECGCFYGNFSAFNDSQAIHMSDSIRWQMDDEYGNPTIIEGMVEFITSGTTDQTDSDDGRILRFLKACILYTLGNAA